MIGLLGCVGSTGACAASQASAEPNPPQPAIDPALVSLRRDNATLRRRVALLEDRMLKLEHREPEALALPTGRAVPVVKLEPDVAAEHDANTSAQPQPEPEPDASGAAKLPVRVRARNLAPLPQPEVEEVSWLGDDDFVDPPESSDDVRSFRLVGDRLVELTKTPPPRPQANPATRKRSQRSVLADYKAARQFYKAGRFTEAYAAFAAIAREHPEHDYADNALYWQGEAAYDQQRYGDALAAFTAVVERYGGGNKAPDALLKIGLCYRRLGDLANARDVLERLTAAYPRARASDIARAHLAELDS